MTYAFMKYWVTSLTNQKDIESYFEKSDKYESLFVQEIDIV